MEHYKNLGGNSNVVGYEISGDSILIEFRSGRNRFYTYNATKPGSGHVDQLKRLAIAGQGLNSYVGTHLRGPDDYFSKR
ncbi:hypothetical protein DXT88_00080 [Herbaspirillum lusitanum]|nr:hypothetical protein [Herbaspirillum lusitanum]